MITLGKTIYLKRSEGAQMPTDWSMCLNCKEKVLFDPLYYPDTLANPDSLILVCYRLVDPNCGFTRVCRNDIWISALYPIFYTNYSYAMFHWQFLPSFTTKWDFMANWRNAKNLTTNFLVFALYSSLPSYERYHGKRLGCWRSWIGTYWHWRNFGLDCFFHLGQLCCYSTQNSLKCSDTLFLHFYDKWNKNWLYFYWDSRQSIN